MANEKIRNALKKCGMCQWKLAILLGISEQTIYRKLRVELPEEEQQKLIELITEHGKENE